MRRIYDSMPEISIDVPTAYVLLEKLGEKMNKNHLLTAALLKDLPARYELGDASIVYIDLTNLKH